MTTFIENAGAAIVSRKIVERTGNIKWLTRETPIAPPDTGWRVLSDRDTDEYLSNPANMTVVEPDGRRRWFDNKTEREITFD